jgi:hypothetical protein
LVELIKIDIFYLPPSAIARRAKTIVKKLKVNYIKFDKLIKIYKFSK